MRAKLVAAAMIGAMLGVAGVAFAVINFATGTIDASINVKSPDGIMIDARLEQAYADPDAPGAECSMTDSGGSVDTTLLMSAYPGESCIIEVSLVTESNTPPLRLDNVQMEGFQVVPYPVSPNYLSGFGDVWWPDDTTLQFVYLKVTVPEGATAGGSTPEIRIGFAHHNPQA